MMDNNEYIKKDKHYKVIDGDVYIKFTKDENNNLYQHLQT